ncbi:hypothetical protein C2142_25220 [Streptomyces sp. CB01881]|nr:hypothetical protein C2142_25220 [Streptomyces sp. CB01881]
MFGPGTEAARHRRLRRVGPVLVASLAGTGAAPARDVAKNAAEGPSVHGNRLSPWISAVTAVTTDSTGRCAGAADRVRLNRSG